jgi:acetyltransferase-like isoleucine patch superfamily enzyme
MKNNQPVLSICIPTYNRSCYLEQTLNKIVNQKIFLNTDEVEIVISDNNSIDSTQRLAESYLKRFPDKIVYSRNETNINDLNFEKAISLSHGVFAKLYNDNLIMKKGSLAKIVDIVKENITSKPVIFFLNNSTKIKSDKCKNLDEFIGNVSYFSTWIGGFGIWREDYDKLKDFSRCSKLQLSQVDVLFRVLANGKKAVIVNDALFDGVPVRKKSGYNIAEVFGKNYLSICNIFLQSGHLSKKVLEKEKKALLLKHIIPFYFDFHNQYNFNKTGYFKFLNENYKFNIYFYLSFIRIGRKLLIKNLIDIVTQRRHPSWQKLNKHNHTSKVNNFENDVVTVGKHTYGPLKVLHYLNPEEKLVIGDYVSIAPNVTFILGGNHQYDGVSSYPFKVMLFNEKYEALTKGPIIVEDDVWIGYGSIILSGVTIGKGSVVGAGSVVTKDIPPYSIVGGNPAKVIKYRFSEEIISKLMDFDFSNLKETDLKDKLPLLYSIINIENIDNIINDISK